MTSEEIYAKTLTLRQQGKTYKEIVQNFNEEKVLSPFGKKMSETILSSIISNRNRRLKELPKVKKSKAEFISLPVLESRRSGKMVAIIGDREDVEGLIQRWVHSHE